MLRASSSKPGSKIGCGVLIDHIEWRLLIPSDPVDLRASLQQILGCTPLATVTGTPKRLCDRARIRFGSLGKEGLDSVQQAEGCCIAQPGMRTSLDESPSRRPVAESACVGEWAPATKDGSGRLDVSPGIEQRLEHRDVIAACGPVQWRFGVSAEPAVCIHIGTSGDQTLHAAATARGSSASTTRTESSSPGEAVMAAKLLWSPGCHPVRNVYLIRPV